MRRRRRLRTQPRPRCQRARARARRHQQRTRHRGVNRLASHSTRSDADFLGKRRLRRRHVHDDAARPQALQHTAVAHYDLTHVAGVADDREHYVRLLRNLARGRRESRAQSDEALALGCSAIEDADTVAAWEPPQRTATR